MRLIPMRGSAQGPRGRPLLALSVAVAQAPQPPGRGDGAINEPVRRPAMPETHRRLAGRARPTPTPDGSGLLPVLRSARVAEVLAFGDLARDGIGLFAGLEPNRIVRRV